MLQISASGEAEARPNEARFMAGVSSIDGSAKSASEVNARKMNDVINAMKALKIDEADIQTKQLTVSRIDYGTDRGKFQANNVVEVRIRDVANAGQAITDATSAGANILSGPEMRVADPEDATRTAYASAYKAARARADTYAEAAGLEVARILAIRDGGLSGQPVPYSGGYSSDTAFMVAPPPVVRPEQAAPILQGTSGARVNVSVDFALTKP